MAPRVALGIIEIDILNVFCRRSGAVDLVLAKGGMPSVNTILCFLVK